MTGIRETTRLIIDRELSPKANALRLQQTAKKGLTDLIASGRASVYYKTKVDGREAISSIGQGQIPAAIDTAQQSVYVQFGFAAEAARYAIDFLKIRTGPTVSGNFSRSFWLSADDRFMMADQFT